MTTQELIVKNSSDNEQKFTQSKSDNKKPYQPTVFGSIGLTFLIYLIGAIISLILMVPFFMLDIVPADTFSLTLSEIIANYGVFPLTLIMIFQVIATLIAVDFIVRQDGKTLSSLGLGLHGYLKDCMVGIGLGALLIGSGFILLLSTGYITISSQIVPISTLLSVVIMMIMVALKEEILIRGFLLFRLMDTTNKYLALLISAVIFTILHLANDNMSFVSVLNLFLAGIFMGIYTIHKHNIWLPICVHFSWNFFQGPIFGFPVSGLKIDLFLVQTQLEQPLITGGKFGLEGSIVMTTLLILAIVLMHLKLTNYSLKQMPFHKSTNTTANPSMEQN